MVSCLYAVRAALLNQRRTAERAAAVAAELAFASKGLSACELRVKPAFLL